MTKPSCCKILEDILKYILYQRFQIPLQYEVLVKSVQNSHTERSTYEEKDQSTDYGEGGYSLKIYHSREDVLWRKKEKKMKEWRTKVKKFVEEFDYVMQMLRKEMESGDITAVSFVLGGSVSNAREVYSVILPSQFKTIQNKCSNDRHISLQFFRAFATNEAMLNHVSKTCSVKKLWVLFQKKKDKVPSLQANWFSTSESCFSESLTPDMVIPHPCFQPSFRSKVILVKIHTESHELPMELTPVVGKGLVDCMRTPFMKLTAKRSLGFSVPKSSKRLSADRSNCKPRQCLCSTLSLDHTNEDKHERDINLISEVCAKCSLQNQTTSFIQRNSHTSLFSFSPSTPCLKTKRLPELIVETPVVTSASRVRTIMEGSPSKLLASKIDSFKLSDNEMDEAEETINQDDLYNKEGRMWYLIDKGIAGFKSNPPF